MKHVLHSARSTRGQALTELALCLPLLLLVFGAIVDLGYLAIVHVSITTSIREALVAGAKSSLTATDIKNIAIANSSAARLSADQVTVELSSTSTAFATGSSIAVQVSYRHSFLLLQVLRQGLGVDLNLRLQGPRYTETSS